MIAVGDEFDSDMNAKRAICLVCLLILSLTVYRIASEPKLEAFELALLSSNSDALGPFFQRTKRVEIFRLNNRERGFFDVDHLRKISLSSVTVNDPGLLRALIQTIHKDEGTSRLSDGISGDMYHLRFYDIDNALIAYPIVEVSDSGVTSVRFRVSGYVKRGKGFQDLLRGFFGEVQ